MGEVINLDERRKENKRESIESTILKNKLKLNPKFISDFLLSVHPITLKHKAAGRIFYRHVGKEHVFQGILGSAKKSGFTDVVVERTALYVYQGEVHTLRDCFSIYGNPPRR